MMKTSALLINLLAISVLLPGCAMTASEFRSAKGDLLKKRSISTIAKQETEQKTDFVVYPNDSGMEVSDGALGKQDATGVIPLLQTLLPLMFQYMQRPPAPVLVEPSTTTAEDTELGRLRLRFNEMKGR